MSSSFKALSSGLFQQRLISSGISFLVGILMLGGIAWTQICLGGTRPAFAYPGYFLVACAGLLSVLVVGVKRYAPGWGILLWTGLFFAYLLVRGFFSSLSFLATTNALLILAALVTYILSAVHLTSVRARLLSISGFLLLEAGHLWLGLTQYASGNKWLLFDDIRPDYGSRASGFYTCPDHLAGFLEMLIMVLLAVGLFGRVSAWLRIIFFYCACAGVAGVLLTGSRAGYLSSGAGVVVLSVYGVYHLVRVQRFRVSLVLLGGTCSCCVVLLGVLFVTHSDLLKDRFGSIVDQDLRPHLWQAGIRAFALDPVMGTGPGTYLVYGREFRDPSVQTDPVYAHNDYIQLLAEYGLIGAGSVLCLLIIHFLTAWKYVRWRLRTLQQKEKSLSSSLALVIGAAAGIAALAVHSIFDFNLQIPGNTLFAAFLFGILANPGIPEKPRAEDAADAEVKRRIEVRQGNGRGSLTWTWKVIPVALSIILIGSIVPRWAGESEVEASRRAFLNGSYALTIYHAKRAAEYGNEEPDLFYYLGESRRLLANQFAGATRLNFLNSAVEAFDQGLKHFPMDERSLVKCGLTQAELGDFQKADTYFNRAFKWDPNLGQIYAFYGARLQLEGRDKDAIAAYQRSNELSVNQIAIGGAQQIQESIKRKESSSTRPD
ncbi:MAG: O-antigen ligase family protein [Verrucomicrobia bacterium]|nr:O-antigen ligase family protein [Verrucomicrobiota bacterium]